MAETEYERLLGGYATGTLTAEERRALFEAALQDQELFNALGNEQALKELLDDPVTRRRLLHALEKAADQPATTWWTPVLEWFRRPANLGLAGSLATAVIALVVGINVYKEGDFPEPGQMLTAEKRPVEQPEAESPAPVREEDALLPKDRKRKDQVPTVRSAGGKTSTPRARPRVDEVTRTDRTGTEQPMAQRPKREQFEGPAGLAGSEEAARSLEGRQGSPHTPHSPSSRRERGTAPPSSVSQEPPLTLRSYFGDSVQEGPARELFYSERKQAKPKERMGAKHEFAESLAPSEPLRADAAREQAKSSAGGMREQKKVGAVAAPATGPLGLRFSVLKRDQKGSYSEVNPRGPFAKDDALRVTVEANAPGYLYMFQEVQTGQWMSLFPSTSSVTPKDFARAQVSSRKRYIIPEAGSLALSKHLRTMKMILVFSREPRPELRALVDRTAFHKSEIEQLATDLGHLQNQLITEAHTTPLQIEEVISDLPGGPSEQAVYIVAPNPTPDSVIFADFQLRQN